MSPAANTLFASDFDMPSFEIQCPQPIRPLTGKFSQLDHRDDNEQEYPSAKRQKLSTFTSGINDWLTGIPFLSRGSTCSDSFPVFNMDQDRRTRSAKTAGTGSARPTTEDHENEQPNSPAVLQAAFSLDATLPSNTPVSRSSHPISNLSKDSKKTNGVQSPLYRGILALHSVYIDPYGISTPATIQAFAKKILEQKRTTSLSAEELLFTRKALSYLANADEGATRAGFSGTSLFPHPAEYGEKIVIGTNIPFDRTALPHINGFELQPIVTPKPDLHYGYSNDSFNTLEHKVMWHNRLQSYAHANSANIWPFFVVEFKSASRGGTHWVAENQNAGNGAHFVNSIRYLLSHTAGNEERGTLDSVAFSCVADGNIATLWVHWVEPGDCPRFKSSEVGLYSLKRPDDVQSFRASVRNIIDYGIDQRLKMIKAALTELVSKLPQWDQDDRLAKIRKQQPG